MPTPNLRTGMLGERDCHDAGAQPRPQGLPPQLARHHEEDPGDEVGRSVGNQNFKIKIKISHFCHQNFSKFLRLYTLFP